MEDLYHYCETCGNVISWDALQNNAYDQIRELRCKYCGGNMINTERDFHDIHVAKIERMNSDRKKYNILKMEEEVRLQFVYDNPKFDQSKYDALHKLWEEEEEVLVNRQNNATYGTLNKPTCPTCQSKKVAAISGLERGASVLTFGLFSKKINKSFKCGNCGYTW